MSLFPKCDSQLSRHPGTKSRGVFHFRKDSETFGIKRKKTEGSGHCQETKSLIMLCCQKWQKASVRYRAGAFSILFQKEAANGNPDSH